MTNNQLAENSVNQLLNSVRLARDNAERADNRVDHSFYYALTIALEELQEHRKAERDSEPMENHIGSKNALDAIVSFIKSKSNPTVKCYEGVSEQLFKDNCHGIHSHVIEYILKLGEELENLRAEQDEVQPVPVVPDERDKAVDADDHPLLWSFNEGWNACRAAMLQAGNSPAQSYCCQAQNSVSPAQNGISPAQSPIDHGYRPECECSGCKATARICAELAGNSQVIPDGYVMVPKEPTKEMLDEFDSIIDYGAEDSQDAWRRLLAAAPQESKK